MTLSQEDISSHLSGVENLEDALQLWDLLGFSALAQNLRRGSVGSRTTSVNVSRTGKKSGEKRARGKEHRTRHTRIECEREWWKITTSRM